MLSNFIEIGGLSISMYAFCIVVGMVIAAIVAVKEGQRLGIDKNKILDGILYCVPLAIVGARLYYVIFEWDNYYIAGDLWQTFINVCAINQGGLAITGGIIVAVIFIIIYCKKVNMNTFKIFDIVMPGLLIGQIFGRWGNFFNQEAYGGVIENVDLMYAILPDFIMDKMFISGNYRHPTFFYESFWNFIGLVLILILRRKSTKVQQGDFLGFYLIWYGYGRSVLIEPYRTDALMLGDIRINVLLPALMVVGGILYLVVKRLKFPQPYYLDNLRIVSATKDKIEDEEVEL